MPELHGLLNYVMMVQIMENHDTVIVVVMELYFSLLFVEHQLGLLLHQFPQHPQTSVRLEVSMRSIVLLQA